MEQQKDHVSETMAKSDTEPYLESEPDPESDEESEFGLNIKKSVAFAEESALLSANSGERPAESTPLNDCSEEKHSDTARFSVTQTSGNLFHSGLGQGNQLPVAVDGLQWSDNNSHVLTDKIKNNTFIETNNNMAAPKYVLDMHSLNGSGLRKMHSLRAPRMQPDNSGNNVDIYEILVDAIMENTKALKNLSGLLKNKESDGAESISYNNTQTVEVKVVFLHIPDIDTLNQQFEAEIYIQARWPEKVLAGKAENDLQKIHFYECWDPKLKILNLVGEPESENTSMVVRYEENSVYPILTYMWHLKGIFRENLELEHFPFDVQELSVIISSERSQKEIELIQDFYNLSSVHPQAMQDSPEFTMYAHVEFAMDCATTDLDKSRKHPVLVVTSRARRQLGYYMWNIVVIVFLILGLTLTILSIDPTGSDRLAVTMTLFLTAVAFKLVVKATLPTISYLTYLDIYVVFTLMYLAAQAAENAIISHLARFREREQVLMYDEIAESLLICLLILFHAAFIIYIQLTALKRRRAMARKDHEMHMSKMRMRELNRNTKRLPITRDTKRLPITRDSTYSN